LGDRRSFWKGTAALSEGFVILGGAVDLIVVKYCNEIPTSDFFEEY
jgi:hypothetical protein